MTPASPEQREQLRLSLMRFLDANSANYGLAESLLVQMAKAEGRHWLTADMVAREMDYLGEKTLAATVQKVLSPENRSWRITAHGRDFLAQHTL